MTTEPVPKPAPHADGERPAPPTADERPERELTEPVALTLPNGSLNDAAIGWARRPLVDTSGIAARHGVRVPGWGRNKRWEYWNVITPTHIAALTISSLDYAAVHEVWIFERATGRSWGRNATVIPGRDVTLPPSLGDGIALAHAKDLAVSVTPADDGRVWRLHAVMPDASFDVTVTRPERHDLLAVVVPWTNRLFQYTVKDVALPASGVIVTDGVSHDVGPGSWAVLDHGRGRWPYDVAWNWGAGSGALADGRSIGIQLGGRWTDGTGSTENGVLVGGTMHKISVPVRWEYDLAAPLRPWRITGGGLDAVFTPFFDKTSRTNLGILSSRTDQCFGHWSGAFSWTDAAGAARSVSFEGIAGFAEDVHNRW